MIEVTDLVRKFGNIKAIDGITFSVGKGEVLGFLGPNGAGKTTTMRVLTCFIPPSSGTVRIGGHDIVDGSMEVRRMIGYLPESVPLYTEMRVREYLEFRAGIKGVPSKNLSSRVEEVIERCWIKDVSGRIIGTLSKGYRQRVGLAEAMVHNPQILILDEPTVGLDPTQIRETRTLVKELGRDHTIVLSTHILPEVEMVCDRVIIIDKGRIVAMDTPEILRKLMGRDRVIAEVRCSPGEGTETLSALPGVDSVDSVLLTDGFTSFNVLVSPGFEVRTDIFRSCSEKSWDLRELRKDEMSLEDIFIHITTKEAGGAI